MEHQVGQRPRSTGYNAYLDRSSGQAATLLKHSIDSIGLELVQAASPSSLQAAWTSSSLISLTGNSSALEPDASSPGPVAPSSWSYRPLRGLECPILVLVIIICLALAYTRERRVNLSHHEGNKSRVR